MLRYIKSLFTLHPDLYVAYRWKKGSILEKLGLENISFIRKLRLIFWTAKARKYKAFKAFYDESERQLALSDQRISEEIKEIYRHGTVMFENFLNEKELAMLNSIIEKIDINSDTATGFVQHDLRDLSPALRKNIISNLTGLYKHFFPQADQDLLHDRIYVGVRIDYSTDGVDKSPITANWHCDRFLPTLNCIYFPHGAEWGAFEKEYGNPVITDLDMKYYMDTRFWPDNNISSGDRDGLYVETGRQLKLLTCEPNTLVAGSHHLQHRRSPYSRPGKRVGIFIDHYNFFTRSHLKLR